MPENEDKVIFTPKVEEEGKIDEIPAINPEELQVPQLNTATELETEEKTTENVEISPEDLDKKNYVKISPTFYLQVVKNEDENDETELFKILNPVEGTVETRELTDEEKKEFLITELKRSKQKFNPLSHPTKVVGTETVVSSIGRERQVKTKEFQTNLTINQFDTKYKQKRRRKNSLAKKSRQKNRK
jgi:hypothetical protein